jgi:hypothetical protein
VDACDMRDRNQAWQTVQPPAVRLASIMTSAAFGAPSAVFGAPKSADVIVLAKLTAPYAIP